MSKLFLTAPKRLAPAIVEELQQAGVLHVDTLRSDAIGPYRLSPEEEARLRGWDEAALAADHALRLLGLEIGPSVEVFAGDLPAAVAAVSALENRAAELAQARDRLADEQTFIDQYYAVVSVLAEMAQGLDEGRRLAVLPFVLDGSEEFAPLTAELAAALDGRFILAQRTVRGRRAAVIVVLKREGDEARGILGRRGLSELPRPGALAGLSLAALDRRLSDRLQAVPVEMAGVQTELRRFAGEAERTLQGIWRRAKDETMRIAVLLEAVSGRYGFGLFGWVPARREARVREALGRFEGRICFRFEPAAEEEAERVPVLLENAVWIRPFEPLITFLNTPRYDSRDPTWTVAVFFPLWFGMIVGDIGYGLVFTAVCAWIYRYVRRGQSLTIAFFRLKIPPQGAARMISVLIPMVAWTFVWGFIYGEFFGDFLQRFGVFTPAGRPGLIPILIARTDTAATADLLILISIGFGVYQVLYGFYLKARRTHRRGEKKHFWEAGGYFGGVAAMVLFAYAFMTRNFPDWIIVLTVAGAVVFIAGALKARSPMMIAELPTQGGHILSYIRIYAVGLASAVLANLTTAIGFGLYHLLGVAGLVAGVVVGVLSAVGIHALLLILLTLSHVLQPIRLIWVEFFTKFDFYSVRGRPYRPFRAIGGSSGLH